jgi:hypothetical protein
MDHPMENPAGRTDGTGPLGSAGGRFSARLGSRRRRRFSGHRRGADGQGRYYCPGVHHVQGFRRGQHRCGRAWALLPGQQPGRIPADQGRRAGKRAGCRRVSPGPAAPQRSRPPRRQDLRQEAQHEPEPARRRLAQRPSPADQGPIVYSIYPLPMTVLDQNNGQYTATIAAIQDIIASAPPESYLNSWHEALTLPGSTPPDATPAMMSDLHSALNEMCQGTNVTYGSIFGSAANFLVSPVQVPRPTARRPRLAAHVGFGAGRPRLLRHRPVRPQRY